MNERNRGGGGGVIAGARNPSLHPHTQRLRVSVEPRACRCRRYRHREPDGNRADTYLCATIHSVESINRVAHEHSIQQEGPMSTRRAGGRLHHIHSPIIQAPHSVSLLSPRYFPCSGRVRAKFGAGYARISPRMKKVNPRRSSDGERGGITRGAAAHLGGRSIGQDSAATQEKENTSFKSQSSPPRESARSCGRGQPCAVVSSAGLLSTE